MAITHNPLKPQSFGAGGGVPLAAQLAALQSTINAADVAAANGLKRSSWS